MLWRSKSQMTCRFYKQTVPLLRNPGSGAPEWLRWLSVCVRLGSWSLSRSWDQAPHPAPDSAGSLFLPLPLPLLILSLSLSFSVSLCLNWINKIFFKNWKKKRTPGNVCIAKSWSCFCLSLHTALDLMAACIMPQDECPCFPMIFELVLCLDLPKQNHDLHFSRLS